MGHIVDRIDHQTTPGLAVVRGIGKGSPGVGLEFVAALIEGDQLLLIRSR